ncbi:MAG: class I SAM-dependent methyltransferase [Pseudomonadales bacterium]|jgi:ubiquinone/menaquinone biosynthesis C-methylase UbiE|tara:strand:+ start:428 stop:1519 length:1092 start_codon:yes stop_codon:yes gene_type:complete
MTIQQAVYKRGKTAGVYPSLTSRRDEAYVNFIEDARNILLHAQQPPIGAYSRQLLQTAGKSMSSDPRSTAEATELLMQDSVLRIYYRVKRSLQESFWTCIQDSFNKRKDALLQALDTTDTLGPGTVNYNLDFPVPDYAKAEIHIQPGGYVNEPLSGLIYDYGIKVFMGGAADNDQLHNMQAESVSPPQDQKVKRILDLGCSAGATTTALKRIYPDAEVWGIDISAPMVRYAHLRAAEQDIEAHFKQMPAEELGFEDNHFDIVVANLLFHEVPVSISKKIIAETLRVLRPGGCFTILDFPGDKTRDVYTMFFAEMDAVDNGEPFITEFVRSNIEELMDEGGFEILEYDASKCLLGGRVGIKPVN